jgi:hypothetical protein
MTTYLKLYQGFFDCLPEMKGSQTNVLLDIAAQSADGLNTPSFRALARDCRVSRRTIGRCVHALAEDRCLKLIERKTKRGRRLANRYIVNRNLIGSGKDEP